MSVTVPPPREGRAGGAPAYAIALVCLGNICRSPTAHVVLTSTLAAAGLGGRVHVSSAGTGGWHVGSPMDPRAAATLREAGYDPSGPRAEQVDTSWFASHDLVLAMDADNLRDLRELAPDDVGTDRLRLFRDFDPAVTATDDGTGTPSAEREVPDPYYGGDDGFAHVLAMVERTSEALTDQLAAQLR